MAIKEAVSSGRVSVEVDGNVEYLLVRAGRAYDTEDKLHAAAMQAAPMLFDRAILKGLETGSAPVADTETADASPRTAKPKPAA